MERSHIMFTLSAVHGPQLPALHTKHFHVGEAARMVFHAASRPERIHYPPELTSLLEEAAMAREMYRL